MRKAGLTQKSVEGEKDDEKRTLYRGVSSLGLIQTRYFCNQYCDKMILMILSHRFKWPTEVSS